MRILLLSDIHGNLSALEAVLGDAVSRGFDTVALLGDVIDYGMRSNETIARLKEVAPPMICKIWGNHEDAILCARYDRFSSERGRECARYTREHLSEASIEYLKDMESRGYHELEYEGKRFLFVHGNRQDPLWGTVKPMQAQEGYQAFDVVFSGHSHRPHLVGDYSPCDCPQMRNQKKTVFLNPGSVGQPRNHNPRAQYAIYNTSNGEAFFYGVGYDICYEQSLYPPKISAFYKERLTYGV